MDRRPPLARPMEGTGRRQAPARPRRRRAVAAWAALALLGSLLVAGASPAQAFGSSQPPPIPSVSAGGYVTCGVAPDGRAVCWGENGVPTNDVTNVQPGGAATPPPDDRFLEVNAGYATACGVRTDRTLVCWGSNRSNKLTVPPGTFTHVAPGLNFVCGLRTDSTLACWGGEDATTNALFLGNVPAGPFTQVSMGNRHACALRADGSIACWGLNADGQTNVPPGTYQQVNVSNFTSCALRTDGTPVCWGRNQGGQQTYPPGTFTQLSTGFAHVCGLRPDGTATCWGRSSEGQTVVPPGTWTQVSAGTFHTCAVPVSGPPVRCWGNNMSGRVQPNLATIPPHRAYAGFPYGFQFTMNPSTNNPTLGGEAKLSPAPTYTLTGGSLPPGLELSPAGLLSGQPDEAGSFAFTVAASNGMSPPDCVNPSVASDTTLPCRPGDPTSVATATRSFTVDVLPDAPVLGGIGGVVTAADGGAPVAGTAVAVTYVGGAPAGSAVTDAGGAYLVGGLPPGSYDVRTSGPELQPETKRAVVTEGQTTTVDFALGPLVRPTVTGVWNNTFQTVTDGLFIEWSETILPPLANDAGYTVHTDAACTSAAVATGLDGNWQPSAPRLRDLVMSDWGNVVPGGSYHLRVAAGVELGTASQQSNAVACVPFVATTRAIDKSAVVGRVTSSATGAPLAGATVTVTRIVRDPGTVAGTATTDGAGNHRVDLQNWGTYRVTAAAAGFVASSSNALAPGGGTVTRDFALGSVPVAGDDSYTHYGSDTALRVAAPGVLVNDADADGSPLTAALVTTTTRGALALAGDGSFTYQPDEDFVGTDTFTYTVNDGTADSAPATVTITVGAGCRGRAATIVGTSGNDRLSGTSGADVIAGLGGNDMINAAGGDDVVCGGSGDDTLNLGGGDDTGDGGSGRDSLRGDTGNDDLAGGDGADTVLGDDGDDVLAGGAGGPDTCNAGAGTDMLAAAHGCEKVSGVP